MISRVAFLDRDGTIIRKAPEGEYTTSVDEVQLLDGAAEGLRMLNSADFHCVVVTNQRGISRGVMTPADYFAVHARMTELLEARGAHLHAEYHCFHGIAQCECRKPATGMLLEATRSIDRYAASASVMIGDADSDVECARRFGIPAVRISTHHDPRASFTARELRAAAQWIVANFATVDPEI